MTSLQTRPSIRNRGLRHLAMSSPAGRWLAGEGSSAEAAAMSTRLGKRSWTTAGFDSGLLPASDGFPGAFPAMPPAAAANTGENDAESQDESEDEDANQMSLADDQFEAELPARLQRFWDDELEVFRNATADTDFTRHDLPIARIRRIMRQDACENPRMIGSDAVQTLAYACELFIRSLTVRAWAFTERSNRHTLQRRDLLCAIMSSHEFDFLIDITTQTLAEVRGELPPPPIPLGNPPGPSQAGEPDDLST